MSNFSGKLLLLASLVSSIAPVVSAPLWAQDQMAPEVENTKYSFSGVVNSNAVYVRSGAGENFYPTLKLDKGAPVTVVGIRFDWLKIMPPDGSFCYVAKAFVEKFGDGSKGRLSKGDVNVRAGSSLNDVKTIVLMKLDEGVEVTILGEKDEYYKIVPPPGSFFYVNKQFVDPVKPVEAVAKAPDTTEPVNTTHAPVDAAPTPTTGPSVVEITSSAPTAAPVALASTLPSAEVRFEQAETAFNALSKIPTEDQAMDEVLTQYNSLSTDDTLAESLKRIVDFRIVTLKVRQGAKVELLALRETQKANQQKQLALKAEHEELVNRVKDSSVQVFSAVGTLQTSSLQQGGQTLYRLTDPATGRTVVYLRSNDASLLSLLGQFVGVRGDVVTDQQLSLRMITPTETLPVDPDQLFKTIAAPIVPPSLAGKAR